MRLLGLVIVLSALWLLMSGVYKPLIIALGAASVAATVLIMRRMDRIDGDRPAVALRPIGMALYLSWLMKEIAKANWTVSRIILSRKMPIRQRIFEVPNSQSTDVGRTIFANSITLTPGTISVETETRGFLVHAVAYSEEDNAALAEMDRRVSAVETAGAE